MTSSIWSEYFHLHATSLALFALVSAGGVFYLLAQREKHGGWTVLTAMAVALLVYSACVLKGARVLISGIQAIAVSGGGTGSFAFALADSRVPVLVGSVLSSIVVLAGLFIYRMEAKRDSEDATTIRRPVLLMVLACAVFVVTVVLSLLDHRLPDFIVNVLAGKVSGSMNKVSVAVGGGILLLQTFSLVAMAFGAALIMIPRFLRSAAASRPAMISVIPGICLLLFFAAQIIVLVRQQTEFGQIAISGFIPGAKPPQSGQVREKDLTEAIRTGDREAVAKIIMKGEEDLDAPDGFLRMTPLGTAVEQGNKDIVMDLINAGADVNALDGNGKTPVMQAVLMDRTEILSELLEAGGDAKAADGNGTTALMSAVSTGNLQAVVMLIEHGADPGVVDRYGISALQVAEAAGREDIVEVLKKGVIPGK